MVPPLSVKKTSVAHISSTLAKSLLAPLGLGLLASVGIHGGLFVVLPLLPSTSVASEPEVERDVQLQELTTADLARLPDFAIAESLPSPSLPSPFSGGVNLDEFGDSDDLFQLAPDGGTSSTGVLNRTTRSLPARDYTTDNIDWFSFLNTPVPPPPSGPLPQNNQPINPPVQQQPTGDENQSGENNQSSDVSTNANDLQEDNNPEGQPQGQPRGGNSTEVPDDRVTRFRNAQRAQHSFDESIAVFGDPDSEEVRSLVESGSYRGLDRRELDYAAQSQYCLTPRPDEDAILAEDLIVSVALSVSPDGEVLDAQPLQSSGYAILNQEAKKVVKTWVETEAAAWAAQERKELEQEGISLSSDLPLIQTLAMEFQYNSETCQGIPGDIPPVG